MKPASKDTMQMPRQELTKDAPKAFAFFAAKIRKGNNCVISAPKGRILILAPGEGGNVRKERRTDYALVAVKFHPNPVEKAAMNVMPSPHNKTANRECAGKKDKSKTSNIIATKVSDFEFSATSV